jgi:hypothetical protein
MIQAAATRAIDFAHADPFDTWWWRRTGWILSELLRERNFKYQDAAAAYYRASLSNARFVEDGSYDERRDVALEKVNDLRKILFPWLAEDDGTRQQAAADLAAVWQTIFGEQGHDAAAIDAAIAAMYAQPVNEEE